MIKIIIVYYYNFPILPLFPPTLCSVLLPLSISVVLPLCMSIDLPNSPKTLTIWSPNLVWLCCTSTLKFPKSRYEFERIVVGSQINHHEQQIGSADDGRGQRNGRWQWTLEQSMISILFSIETSIENFNDLKLPRMVAETSTENFIYSHQFSSLDPVFCC